MHIIVILRLVPDLSGEVALAADGKSIDREWLDLKLCEFDDHALEEAIILKEVSGARVTAVALAGDGADRLLQSALARGADQAMTLAVDSDADSSSRRTAALFAEAIRRLEGSLVFTGVQTPEDIYGQLAPYLGAALSWPQASAVSGVKADGDGVVVQQEFNGGVSAALRLTLPAVVGIQTASQPIRYVSGSKLRQAMSAKIGTMDLSDSAIEPAVARTELVRLAASELSGTVVMFEGDAAAIAGQMVDVLVERGLLK